MERKTKIPNPLTGELVEATEIGHRSSGEHWNEHLLDDGTVVRVKLIVTNIYRVDDGYNDKGEPVYMIESNNVVSISVPQELKKQ